MKTILKLICLLLTLPFVAAACKQEAIRPDEPPLPLPENALSYFYFKPATYWVYQNDKTGQIDTQTILTANRKWIGADADNSYEEAAITIKSTFKKYTEEHKAIGDKCTKQERDSGITKSCWIKTGRPSSGYYTTWRYPFREGLTGESSPATTDNSMYTVLEMYDSLQLNNTTFLGVAKIQTTNARFYYRKNINVFWAKGVGIIKMENLTDGETWNLIDFKIVQ
jgi:hypothetical protein